MLFLNRIFLQVIFISIFEKKKCCENNFVVEFLSRVYFYNFIDVAYLIQIAVSGKQHESYPYFLVILICAKN